MSVINITVIDQTLTITNSPVIATGGMVENYVEFDFDSAWSGMSKIAIFYQDKEHVYRQVVDENDKCVIPHEATATTGTMFMGVFGASGDTILTSEVIKYRIVQGAITEDTEPSDPTPDVYEQMLQIYNSLLTSYKAIVTNLGDKSAVSDSRSVSTFWQILEYVAKYIDTDLTTLINSALANSSVQGVLDLINNSVIPEINGVDTGIQAKLDILEEKVNHISNSMYAPYIVVYIYDLLEHKSLFGATVTCTLGVFSFTQTTQETGYILFNVPIQGSWSVYAQINGKTASTTVSVTETRSYSVTLYLNTSKYNAILSQNSWGDIAEVSKSGKASNIWNVGDEKNITVGNETLTMVILGFNHDDDNSITFGMKNLMASEQKMNSSDTNKGGFTSSSMYTYLNTTVFNQLPTELQSNIRSVNKKTSAGSRDTTINTNSMKLFLFSEIELFGSNTNAVSGEGKKYSYFANNTVRTKCLSNGSGLSANWWQRSPYYDGINGFCVVSDTGAKGGYSKSSSERGVCFGFVV